MREHLPATSIATGQFEKETCKQNISRLKLENPLVACHKADRSVLRLRFFSYPPVILMAVCALAVAVVVVGGDVALSIVSTTIEISFVVSLIRETRV